MYDILSNPTGLIVRQQPGFDGSRFYAKFDSLITTSIARDKDELCSEEYFDKMDNEIQNARDHIEQIINKLIIAAK